MSYYHKPWLEFDDSIDSKCVFETEMCYICFNTGVINLKCSSVMQVFKAADITVWKYKKVKQAK